jgi:hypothetical protein
MPAPKRSEVRAAGVPGEAHSQSTRCLAGFGRDRSSPPGAPPPATRSAARPRPPRRARSMLAVLQ